MILRPLFAAVALGGALVLTGCCCTKPRRPCPPPAVVGTAQVGEPCCNGAGPGVGGIPPPPAPIGGVPPPPAPIGGAGPFAPPPNGGFR